ncbi:MAG: cyanophycin synthetase [Bacillota bacterium]
MKVLRIKAFEGRNIHCHRPVISMDLDLEEYAAVTTSQIQGFVERLVSTLPSLSEHHCSTGEPGGFVLRVKRGTYLGHVVEHVALELQALLGCQVIFGKTRALEEPRVYSVVYEYECRELGIEAGYCAVRLVDDIARGNSPCLAETINHLKEVYYNAELGPSTKAIVQAARKRNIPVLRLNEGSLIQLGYGAAQKRIFATITSCTSSIGVDIAANKTLTKKLLQEMGVPVPPGGVATREEELERLAQELGYPLVVKPLDGNQGKGVSLNLNSLDELRGAFAIARKYSDEVIVERHIPGRHYRILVVGSKVVAVSERIPAHVVGDGVHTISQLVDIVNSDPRRGENHEKPLTKIRIDEIALNLLSRNRLSPEYVPATGEIVYLRENANLSTGGIAIDVTEEVHPYNQDLALRVAQFVGLDVAGIDVVVSHISVPITPSTGAVIEVNACPGLRMHHFPWRGMPRDAGGAIVDMLFPDPERSRIPLVAVTGTNGKTTVARMIAHVLSQGETTVGLACTDGIYVGNTCMCKGDCSGPASTKRLLLDPKVQAAVLEVARGGIIREGLGFDYCDVGVVTNITGDHVGQDGVDTLEDLAFVKSLVIEAVRADGTVVLNADDPASQFLVRRASAPITYFSRQPDNIVVHRHIARGGAAVVLQKGVVYAMHHKHRTKVLSVRCVPACAGGKLVHNVENLLATVAACVGLGLSAHEISSAMRSFSNDLASNPGRFNLFDLTGVKLIVDYAHNAPALRYALSAARSFCSETGRLMAVVASPGDRRDQDIRSLGSVAGELADYVIIKEDSDLRGRRPLETAHLIRQGVLRTISSPDRCIVEPKEEDAVRRALGLSKPGDVVVVFYERLEPLMDALRQWLPSLPSEPPHSIAIPEGQTGNRRAVSYSREYG